VGLHALLGKFDGIIWTVGANRFGFCRQRRGVVRVALQPFGGDALGLDVLMGTQQVRELVGCSRGRGQAEQNRSGEGRSRRHGWQYGAGEVRRARGCPGYAIRQLISGNVDRLFFVGN
jgi:hypothetical protein